MKRLLLVGLPLLVLGVFGLRWAIHALASDETRIRWMVEAMEEGFNDGSAKGATGGLGRDWRHEGMDGLDAETLRGMLLREFMELRRRDGELSVRIEVPEDTLAITVDGESATLECEALMERRREGKWTGAWRSRIEGELRKGEEGWEILRTRHEDLEGRGW